MSGSGSTLKKDLTAEEFERFRDLIHEHSGIYLENSQLDSLRISLVTRATKFDLCDYDAYYGMLVTDEDEFKELMNLVTINETSFFRFPAQFKVLHDFVIGDVLTTKSKLSQAFRVWSAGCSTGEEPYSIAMTLLDSPLESLGYRCEVLGTDVSTQALDRARKGMYPSRSLEILSPDVVARWFEHAHDRFRPVQRVRDIVNFSYHNLIRESHPVDTLSGFDVIFCRNVTIYFRIESTRRVMERFFEALNPGGYLFIGHSETLSTITDRFEVIEHGGVFLYRKPKPQRHHSLTPGVEEAAVRPRVMRLRHPAESQESRKPSRPRPEPRPAPVPVPAEPEPVLPARLLSEQLLPEARELLERGCPAEACMVAERILVNEPRNTGALLISAYAHADAGDLDAAIVQVNTAIGIDPLLAEARYILGIIFQRRGDSDAALAEFRRTIYIDNEFVLAHFSAANLHRARGALEEACREYENTLRSLYMNPAGSWTVFLGGFRPDLLVRTCERSLLECRKGS